eukprot:a842685_236.p2 GENE.a842685_236~~a842685_236.p2  ORF type:complete len:160 (+),score=73.45 a842685_236:41-481(+)
MAAGGNDEQMREYRAAFQKFDKGSGIKLENLGDVLRELGQNYPPAELQKMGASIQQGGMITFNRFTELMATRVTSKPMSEQEVLNAFKVFDKDGTGFINVRGLTEAMSRYGERLTADEMKALIEDSMPDQDGFVDIQELAKLITSA